MKTFVNWMCFVFDILVPRFITENVALERVKPGEEWDSFKIACCMDDVKEGEVFAGVATIKSFTWLGFGFMGTMSNFRTWENRS